MDESKAVEEPVLFEELQTASGQRIGHVTLNVPATLNSLSLAMIDLLAPVLANWEQDAQVVAIVLRGSGDRALAAGGDIQALYRAMAANAAAGAQVDDYCDQFFEREYRLDCQLHRMQTPVIVWGHGIVMGGGLGLFSAGTFRLATAKSRFGLPEITIGLFPDAGATWMFRSLSVPMARFIGWAGANWTGADALGLGLATHWFDPEQVTIADIVDALCQARWQGEESVDVITAVLGEFASQPPEAGPLVSRRAAIEAALTPVTNLREADAAMAELAAVDAWFERALGTFRAGCPTTAGIVLHQSRVAPTMDLPSSFQFELTVAMHCARNGEFVEGVRALLIDKDNAPAWQYTYDTVTTQWVDSHFAPLLEPSPLADLLAD